MEKKEPHAVPLRPHEQQQRPAAGPGKAPMVEPPLDRDVLEQELEELMR